MAAPKNVLAFWSARKQSVTRRVTLSFVIVTAAFSLVAGWNVWALRAATTEAEMLRSGYLPLALSLRDAVLGQDTWNSQLNHITTAQNPADKRVWFDSTLAVGRPRTFAAVRSALERAFGGQTDELRALGRRLASEASNTEMFFEGDREFIARLFASLEVRDVERAQGARDELVRRGHEGRQRLSELEREVRSAVDGLLDDARARERWAIRLLLLSVGFTALVGLLVTWRARRLLLPLGGVTERAKAVARGDLTPRPVVVSEDEIGELAQTFENMVAAIARANMELLASERLAAIGKMAAQVTHEIRNPLSSLALNVELLEEELGDHDEESRALLRAVKLEVERLIQLSEKYLSLARRSRPDFQQEDLGDVVREALAASAAELARHNVQSVLSIEESLPPVRIDELQIRQVLLNLIRNAREAMDEGGELQISVKSARAPARAGALPSEANRDAMTVARSEAVEISVADSGGGMDEATQKRVFEPFFTTKGHGTGLGLAITQEIVEAHGGVIRCERREPRGTRFVIVLPTVPPGAAPAAPALLSQAHADA
jgi:two-component system, NtrC family, sensor kinase